MDIPIKGKPEGKIHAITPSGQSSSIVTPLLIALSLKGFEDIKFRLLVKVDDVVKIGQPLVEDKSTPGRVFASPAAGVIKEIRRGQKRTLQDIVIEVAKQENYHEFPPIDIKKHHAMKSLHVFWRAAALPYPFTPIQSPCRPKQTPKKHIRQSP